MCLGLLLGCLMAFSNLSDAQKFVIPVFPDSHVGIPDRIEMFYTQMKWVAAQKDSLNIPFVCHVGDLVNCNNTSHWDVATAGFKVLDSAGVSYAITLGNHDTEAVGENSGSAAPGNVNQNLRKTTKFNSYFPVSRFKVQVGRYVDGKSDNASYTFKAGGLNWMVLTLEFCARQGPVDWANGIVAAHPDYNVIILTHYHLTPNGGIGETNAGYGDLSPEQIYNRFIVKHPNILLVLCGHNYISSWRNDKGEKGNRVYQILQDFTDSADYAGGYLRLLEIDPDKRSITGNAYSPLYKKWKQDDSMIRFTGVKFIQPK